MSEVSLPESAVTQPSEPQNSNIPIPEPQMTPPVEAASGADEDNKTNDPEPVNIKEKDPMIVSNEQLAAEVTDLSQLVLTHKGKEADQKQKKGETLSVGEKSARSLQKLKTLTSAGRNGIPCNVGEPAMVIIPNVNHPVALMQIHAINGDTFKCRVSDGGVEYSTVGNNEITLSRQQVIDAYTIAESGNILQVLSPEEQAVFKAQVDLLQNPDQGIINKNPDELNRNITKVAEQNGIVTSVSMDEVIEAMANRGELSDDKRKALKNIIAEKNILGYKELTATFQVLGVTDAMSEITQGAQTDFDNAVAQLQVAPDNPILKKQLDAATKALTDAEDMHPEKVIPNILTKMAKGEMSGESVNQLIESLKSGNSQAMIDAFMTNFNETADDTEETKELKQKKRELLYSKIKTSGKDSGIGLGIGLLYIFVTAAKELQNLQ